MLIHSCFVCLWSPCLLAALPPVRDQGDCGSCWAIVTAAIVEAAHFKVTGELIQLSVEQLLDCDAADQGCAGGFFYGAMQYARDIGLCKEAQYPYAGVKGWCGSPVTLPLSASKLASYSALPSNNEAAMLAALASGPIAVAVRFWY